VIKQLLNSVHDRLVFRRRVHVLAGLLSQQMPGGATVLDVGSGDGSIASEIMRQQPRLDIRGIDVMLRPKTSIQVDLFDGTKIPFPDKSFDWVTIVDVLHHTDDPKQLIGEAARVAKLGVVIKDHLREGFGAYTTLRLMDWVGNWGHDVGLVYNYMSKAEWNRMFSETGLRPKTWSESLHLYPGPFGNVFDRQLHFVAMLR
jgi:2-polyprenyl-3-methyl-5-hydroxy-6-metoxy-1,4-benzoquinol methylase